MSIPFAQTFTVTRYAVGGTYGTADGEWTSAGTSTVAIQASVQPAPGKELLHLAESDRSRDARLVFTTTELFPAVEGAVGVRREPDEIAINGDTFQINRVEPWQHDSHSDTEHYKCLALKKN